MFTLSCICFCLNLHLSLLLPYSQPRYAALPDKIGIRTTIKVIFIMALLHST
ncbi:hypothetical protein IscW_ISCW009165 [Ixodes scapularis]|uniref:Secreted protein n=1 Tax=Ixodes scapularis TaxID=6945 RepID=B7Q0W1_IXOSC|nr:hypothetical protein IscW_ISCW009165 [Ixodes scapularis]|eukprot:XP_002408554.1 hypothetical protein IscW_ISCW009165 [Ixodes scapularis]